MRHAIIGVLTALLFTCACNKQQDKVSGTYVLAAESEFSVVWDTVTIIPLEPSRQAFHIVRKTGFQQKLVAITNIKEFRQDTAIALYDDEKDILTEQRHGRAYIIAASGNTLIQGDALYTKIED